ncbi:hypothetical protein CC78DRAFT_359364 [Lojkania enalia]|uniref:Uncharacterized protein n=1 Tax=Lojkania enalia TaxID=147567 RepID=A0A9P4N192_9PLEO|nr:hypothetical protein CC78DRAFT_359364 [Didymosphaeria enalia]
MLVVMCYVGVYSSRFISLWLEQPVYKIIVIILCPAEPFLAMRRQWYYLSLVARTVIYPLFYAVSFTPSRYCLFRYTPRKLLGTPSIILFQSH